MGVARRAALMTRWRPAMSRTSTYGGTSSPSASKLYERYGVMAPGAGTMAPSSSVTARGPRAARVLAWVSLAVGLASLTMSVTQTIARSGSLGAGWLRKPPLASAR